MSAYLQVWIDKAPTLAASLGAVLFMAGVAALLGFRQTARLTDEELRRLARAERLDLKSALIAPNGKSALALLDGGRLMVARVMGADISTRIVPAATARVRSGKGKLSVAFADAGFPPLHMKAEPPPWLADLGEAQ